jgi:hypothetical protein
VGGQELRDVVRKRSRREPPAAPGPNYEGYGNADDDQDEGLVGVYGVARLVTAAG